MQIMQLPVLTRENQRLYLIPAIQGLGWFLSCILSLMYDYGGTWTNLLAMKKILAVCIAFLVWDLFATFSDFHLCFPKGQFTTSIGLDNHFRLQLFTIPFAFTAISFLVGALIGYTWCMWCCLIISAACKFSLMHVVVYINKSTTQQTATLQFTPIVRHNR